MPGFRHLNGNTSADQAFSSITASFAQMNGLLKPSGIYKDGYYPLRGEMQFRQAYDLLQKAGFESSLALRILSTYLLSVDSAETALLIPAESLPILTTEDRPHIEHYFLSDDCIIFKKDLYDCYRRGDQYNLLVAARCTKENRWVVYEWLLFEISGLE